MYNLYLVLTRILNDIHSSNGVDQDSQRKIFPLCTVATSREDFMPSCIQVALTEFECCLFNWHKIPSL